jgi:hypothetical protein
MFVASNEDAKTRDEVRMKWKCRYVGCEAWWSRREDPQKTKKKKLAIMNRK